MDLDNCCHAIFNNTFFITNLKNDYEGRLEGYEDDWRSDLRKEIQRNFTINDCQLSGLHQPPDSPPRTSFDNNICCDARARAWLLSPCIQSIHPAFVVAVDGRWSWSMVDGRVEYLSAVAGIQILSETSLAKRTPSWTCPRFFCKRQSLARPGKVICCPLTRRLWGNTRVLVCPRSCD